MPTRSTTRGIEHLRRAILLRDGTGLGDGELLGRFIERRDEAALSALVQRHAPMVWGVCRRLLSHHDAEDAFQATFIVLVRKASAITPREMVGNWLYGVAHQAALQARRTATRRRAREVQVTEMPKTEAKQHDQWSDVQPLLDQELSRLPDYYRVVIVLCDLEGRTRKEVARQLEVPEGTVAGRLARARVMLAKRLTKRGVTLSGGALATVLTQNVASAGVPVSVVSSTIQVATLISVGQTEPTGAISVKVAALTEGVLKAMLMSKLKAVVAVVLVLGLLATGAMGLGYHKAAAQGDKSPTAEERVTPPPKDKKEKEKEVFTAWGKEVGGVQAGLGYRPGEKRAYRHGETVTLVVRVRNVGKQEIKFQYLRHFFIENPPAVVDDQGKAVALKDGTPKGIYKPVDVTLAPGKEIELYELNLEVSNNNGIGVPRDSTLNGTGKFSVQYERVLGNSSLSSVSIKFDPILSKLGTGKLELEVKSALPPAAEKKDPQKQEKEAFTAWGKEVNGLQAGVGLPAGQKRAYSHGETVKLVVRVRNVGKEAIKFSYLMPYIEHEPIVTDVTGKSVPQPDKLYEIGERLPGEVELAPGKEIELHELKRELRPASESGSKRPRPEGRLHALYGTGKVSVQYEQVLGDPSLGHPGWKLDPVLSKLGTGKLELEVKDEEKVPPQKEKEGFTAWGKEVGGLQAGLGLLPGEKRTYHPGETVTLVVKVRNVGKEAVKFEYIRQFLDENRPTVTDADGKTIPQSTTGVTGVIHVPIQVTLEPGKEVVLESRFHGASGWPHELLPARGEGKSTTKDWPLAVGIGKVSLQYDRVFGNSSAGSIKLDAALSALATGKLELEIRPDPPPAATAPAAESPEENVKKLKLVEVFTNKTSYTTTPTPDAPRPPVIHFFWGKKNEVRVAPGQSALVELPKRVTEISWNIPGYVPDGAGSEDGPEFDFVYCKWDRDGKVTVTMYKKP